MSKTTAARRVALLGSSSLGLAAIVSAASLGAALAPSAAFAQTVSCTSGTAVAGTPSAVTIAGGNPNNPGINCQYTGAGATVTTLGATTVSTVNTPPLNGVNLTATSGSSISWTSTAGTVTGGAETNGAVIDARTTGAGAITINTAGVTGTAATVTHGIFAQASGSGGAINITNTGTVSGTNATSGVAGIEAIANGGNITITSNGDVNGKLSGIIATNTTGDIVTRGGSSLRATTTSGNIDITRTGGGSVNATTTAGGDITILNHDGATVTIDTSVGGGFTHITNVNLDRDSAVISGLNATVGVGGLVLDVTGVTGVPGGASTGVGASDASNLTAQGVGAVEINVWRDEFLIRPPGQPQAGLVLIDANYARLFGPINFSGLSGGATINILGGGAWLLNTDPVLSPSADTVHIGEGGFLHTRIFNNTTTSSRIHTINFNDGEDVLVNEGRILVGVEKLNIAQPTPFGGYAGVARDRYEAELILQDLERFENNGEIWMGTSFRTGDSGTAAAIAGDPEQVFYAQGTDRAADDMLTMPGTTFVGGENGRILLDVNLSYLGAAQVRCDNTMRDAGGSFPAADCINLQNGATEGKIYLSVTDTGSGGGRGAYNSDGIVIIDMSDGAGGPGSGAGGAAGQVAFAPEMRFFNPAFGGILDNGMLSYVPYYDEALMQFKIVGAPSGGAFHQPLIVNGAQVAWRSANAGYFDRQADLRDTLRSGEERTSGAWMRAGYEKAERDTQHAFALTSGDIDYDNTHDLNVGSLTVGGDFLGALDGEDYWVLGGMLGYVRTDIEYENWTDAAAMNGILLGAYGSFVEGPLFVDVSVASVWNKLDQDIPQAELFRDAVLKTNVDTLGVQAEAGWRFDLGAARIEPLLNASWVRTRADDFKVPEDDPLGPGNQVMFEEAISTRAGVGVRGSTTVNTGVLAIGLSLTGRYSREFDGEAAAAISNLNPISPVVLDEFDGNFGEIVGGVTVSDTSGRISGVLNIGARQGDDYQAITASAAFRYQW